MDLKAFKGTFIVGGLLLAAWAAVTFIEDPVEPPPVEDLSRPLFTFEKHDLVRIEVDRPGSDDLVLVEQDSGWIIDGTQVAASKSMVNRVKHQLHDLTARARVVEEGEEDPALYGLGEGAVRVTLLMRDGRELAFRAGDPNPSSVSYYIQPEGGDIYTVKKSAVDYYSMAADEFREPRFASFDAKDADQIHAWLPQEQELHLQRTGERSWVMLEPVEMDVSLDRARSLMGRIAVLKSSEYPAELPAPTDEQLAPFGLDQPLARFELNFGTRPPLKLHMGSQVLGEYDPPLHYFRVEGDPSIYVAKGAFLDDFTADPAEFRLRDFVGLNGADVVHSHTVMHQNEDPKLVGEVTLTRVADIWQWFDGSPVPGSTPRRLAQRVAGLEAEEFVADKPGSLAAYGLDQPVATVTLRDDRDDERVVELGGPGPAREMETEEGTRTIERIYARLADGSSVYLVEAGVLSVLEDAMREQSRKLTRDEDKAERLERVEEEMQNKEPGQ